MNYCKFTLQSISIAFFSCFFCFQLHSQTVEVIHQKTLLLTETDNGSISLPTSRFGLRINKYLHDDDLSFFARQMSDSSYLRIQVKSEKISHKAFNSTFFLFRTNTNCIQSVLKYFTKQDPDTTATDKLLIYDFHQERMVGAVELENQKSKPGSKFLVIQSGVIPTVNYGKLFVVQYLEPKTRTDFCFYKLDEYPANNNLSPIKLSHFNPKTWQSLIYENQKPILKLSTRTDQPYPLGAGNMQIDRNEEFVGLRHNHHLFGNLKNGQVYEISPSRLERDWTLLDNGKVIFEKRESEETKSGTNFYSTVVIYDFVNDKQVKQIVLPGKKRYEIAFSGGRYLIYWDGNPQELHFSPKLFDIETETEVPFILPSPMENDNEEKKKKVKGSMTQILLTNGISYQIKNIIFDKSLRQFAITSFFELKSATSEVKYTVNGKQILYEEFIDMYSIQTK